MEIYNPPLTLTETIYCTFTFLTGTAAFNQMSVMETSMSYSLYAAYVLYILGIIQIVGYYLDKDERATDFDVIRLLVVCLYCIWSGNVELCGISALSMVFTTVFIKSSRGKEKREKLS